MLRWPIMRNDRWTSRLLHIVLVNAASVYLWVFPDFTVATSCVFKFNFWLWNKLQCTDGLKNLTVNNKIVYVAIENLGTEPTTLLPTLKRLFQDHLHARDPQKCWSAINFVTGRQEDNHPLTMRLSSLAQHFKSLLHQPRLPNVLRFGPDKKDTLSQYTFTSLPPAEVSMLLKNLVTDKAAGRPAGIRLKDWKKLQHRSPTRCRLSSTNHWPLGNCRMRLFLLPFFF